MIHTEQLFKDKNFPNWFKNHPIFKTVKTIRKVFPSIGIPNFESEIEVDNLEPAKISAKALKTIIGCKLNSRIQGLEKFVKEHAATISDARKAHATKCSLLLSRVASQLEANEIVRQNNGRLSLKLLEDVLLIGDARPTFRVNESVFRVYNKLTELLREQKFAGLPRLENLEQFKTFSTDNIPNSKFKVVFSSDGADGAWDIGTMSARGIRSCQSWENGEYKHCTIGSVIDPFVGIIYLTSGGKFNSYGSKMVKRCIVRFVIDGDTKKPYLFLDNMYPNFDPKVFTQFKKSLQGKNSNLIVQYGPNMNHESLKKSYIPLSGVRATLQETDRDGEKYSHPNDLETIQSYQDIRINSKLSNKNDSQSALYAKNAKNKEIKFVKSFQTSFTAAIKKIDITTLPEAIKSIATKLKGDDKKNFNYAYITPELARIVANQFISGVDKKDFHSSDTYARRLYYNYFNNKKAATVSVKAKIAKELNGRMKMKPKDKISADNIMSLIQILFPIVDQTMKENLKLIVDAKKIGSPLPLP